MHIRLPDFCTYKRAHNAYSVFIAVILAGTSTKLIAESSNEPLDTKPAENVEEAIDGVHEGASRLLNSFASQIDNYFAEEVDVEEVNTTRATIRFDFADPGGSDFDAKMKLKLRLVLPRSQRRVRLLLDVDDEDNTDDSRSSSAQSIASTEEDRNLSLALRFIRKARAGVNFDVDIGARRHEKKIQGFARLRASTQRENKNGWSSKFNNDFRQYHSSGYWNRLNIDFWHNTREGSSTVFRTSSNLTWERNAAGARIDQSAGIYKELDKGALLAFEALAGYNTSPDETENYYEGHQLRLRYRRNAFRPWFHFEVWPSISWLTSANREPKLGGLLRTEIRFGQY